MALINGTSGNDNLLGTLGDDTINGGGGNDFINGGEGNDTLNGGTGNDQIDGGIGNDKLIGGTGNDVLFGWTGDDNLDGGSDDDQLFGEEGNDTMNGGSGNDVLGGGTGNDNMDGGSGIDTLYGQDGDDVMNGGSDSSTDTLFGGTGNDTMDGGSGNDFIYGEAGNDTIKGGSGNDLITGDDGVAPIGPNLVVNGSFEADAVPGGSFTIFPGSITGWTTTSGDGIELQNGAIMAASDGTQLAELDSNNNSNMYQDIATGGTGAFQLSFDYSPRPGVDAASNGVEVYWDGVLIDTLTGDVAGFTTHTYNVNGAGATTRLEFKAVGTDDSLGGFLDNVKVQTYGGEGSNDTIDGGSGNDNISGGYGDDVITGGSGDDIITAGEGNDKIDAGSGNDNIDGGTGNDTFITGSGTDTIIGGEGDDNLNGGSGADLMTGGSGADIFDFNALTDSTLTQRDLIQDFSQGNDHIELIGLGFTGIAAGAATGTTLGYSFDGTNTIVTADGSDFSLALTGNHALTNADFFFA